LISWIMPTHRPFQELQARLAEMLEASPVKNIERNAKAFLVSGFSRLDLVTREEFDLQAKLLARTQQKLAALEARVALLEPRLQTDAIRPDSTDPRL
jgi:ubiquinone biosynthesis accessory factor UbiK